MQKGKILVANRGEIALRIIQSCKKLGYLSVAVFSEADRFALHVNKADEAVCLGDFEAIESYLNINKIVKAAQASGAFAIHPGYGFLSENFEFADACQSTGLTFIGPSPTCIEKMGDKAAARVLAIKCGVPVIKGYAGEAQDQATLSSEAQKIGFPILLKPSAGGGGKGMRLVSEQAALLRQIQLAKSEALSAFGNDKLIVERYVKKLRHIEFQVVGDFYGNLVHCFERECTIQRRHQKIIEETPSVALNSGLRQKMADSALKLAKIIEYDSVGTVEFLLDEFGEYYFLEMNTRLQVEHPVTEMTTGLDLVAMQIEIACGKKLSISQKDIFQVGHAIECRLYAEDPSKDFLPQSGMLRKFAIEQTDGVRLDTGVQNGCEVKVFYDPLLAKITCLGSNREEATRKMLRVLKCSSVLGLKTNQNYLGQVLQHKNWQSGELSVDFVEANSSLKDSAMPKDLLDNCIIASSVFALHKRQKLLPVLGGAFAGFRNNKFQNTKEIWQFEQSTKELAYNIIDHSTYEVFIGGAKKLVTVNDMGNSYIILEIDGFRQKYSLIQNDIDSDESEYSSWIGISGYAIELSRKPRFIDESKLVDDLAGCVSPMPGKILQIMVQKGQQLKKGEELLVIEAMKMQHSITASIDGTIEHILVELGQFVEADMPLVRFLD